MQKDKYEGEKRLGRPKHKWNDNYYSDLTSRRCYGLDLNDQARDRIHDNRTVDLSISQKADF